MGGGGGACPLETRKMLLALELRWIGLRWEGFAWVESHRVRWVSGVGGWVGGRVLLPEVQRRRRGWRRSAYSKSHQKKMKLLRTPPPSPPLPISSLLRRRTLPHRFPVVLEADASVGLHGQTGRSVVHNSRLLQHLVHHRDGIKPSLADAEGGE